ncbi:hypothetical protein B0H67DRAFT_575600 [Lasiosphaeris hirsuta]|uniref:Uncharacterized protein n=1 Tax=Lasiosphaeris hirsuta TaxID=260670 RepID=A0AA40AQV8_9PEZI|nr:hypothetical protein B0H67DRAFT_575600 [Lasiosphaeris hirsuta]
MPSLGTAHGRHRCGPLIGAWGLGFASCRVSWNVPLQAAEARGLLLMSKRKKNPVLAHGNDLSHQRPAPGFASNIVESICIFISERQKCTDSMCMASICHQQRSDCESAAAEVHGLPGASGGAKFTTSSAERCRDTNPPGKSRQRNKHFPSIRERFPTETPRRSQVMKHGGMFCRQLLCTSMETFHRYVGTRTPRTSPTRTLPQTNSPSAAVGLLGKPVAGPRGCERAARVCCVLLDVATENLLL